MSLINDALKRVKEAQRQAPPAASVGPQLRPVEPVPTPRRTLGVLLPVGLLGVALLALLLIWTLAKKADSSAGLPVRAQAAVPQESAVAKLGPETMTRSSETASAVPNTGRDSSLAGNSSVAQPAPLASKLAPGGATATNSAASETAATNSSSSVPVANAYAQSGNTNSPAAVEAQPPQPPPLKLQGIVFSQRPSAVINGRTLFVGDRIREFRVVAITRDTALLAGGGRTNLLSFSE
jgi:hypothetical protein